MGIASGKSAFWIESFIGFSFGKKLILVILFYHIKRNCGIITERQMRYSAAPNPFSAFAQGGETVVGAVKSAVQAVFCVSGNPGIPGGSKAMIWRKLGLCGTPFFRFVESVVVGKIKQLP